MALLTEGTVFVCVKDFVDCFLGVRPGIVETDCHILRVLIENLDGL